MNNFELNWIELVCLAEICSNIISIYPMSALALNILLKKELRLLGTLCGAYTDMLESHYAMCVRRKNRTSCHYICSRLQERKGDHDNCFYLTTQNVSILWLLN